jgi:hypothetical protein
VIGGQPSSLSPLYVFPGFRSNEPGEQGCTMRVSGYASLRFAVPHISGTEIVIGVLVILVFLSLVAAPVLGEIVGGAFSVGAHKAAPWVFVIGLAVLGIGIGFGLTILDIVGGAMVGSVILGIIAMNYLMHGRADSRARSRHAESAPAPES